MKSAILGSVLIVLAGNAWAGQHTEAYPTGMDYSGHNGDRNYCEARWDEARDAMVLRLTEGWSREVAIKEVSGVVDQLENEGAPKGRINDQLAYLRVVHEAFAAKVPATKSRDEKIQAAVNFADGVFEKCFGLNKEKDKTKTQSADRFSPYNTEKDCKYFADQMGRYLAARINGYSIDETLRAARNDEYIVDGRGHKDKVISAQVNLANAAYTMNYPLEYEEFTLFVIGVHSEVSDICMGR